MEFIESLKQALSQNNGRVSLQQAVDLLPDASKHRVMHFLNAARNSGACQYTVKRENGKMEIIITSPQGANPQTTAPVVPPNTPPVGGTS